ncbi:fimbria/pilus outer membrane usher protein (plasmid) [Serratia sp. JSRIV002]|uniref:fimbria/pilus outer membrane usher protein n=1 Tax=Serratia sp. JSRIV002 TaxID=2831894 RepID=UPI001CBF85A0|nr:fimbria/pilus outer membrane usher protein [Serratia sp. JSRIV002]UAN54633.1 fimbria/pilus outer membrane usher protein [Serratia sp. JSRIV002]
MDYKKKYSFITTVILFLFMVASVQAEGETVEFETRALGLGDNKNVNLSDFSRSDYIPEGIYPLTLMINDRVITNYNFNIINVEDKSQICFPLQIVEKFDLKEVPLAQLRKNTIPGNPECILITGYQGATTRVDREKSILLVSVPQALLNYSDPDWSPPSQWDDGVPGILFDYTLSGNLYGRSGSTSNSIVSSFGTLGANYNSWRLRSNYQASLYSSGYGEKKRQFSTTAVYVTRSLKEAGAHLTIGKNYLQSDVFGSLNYRGVSIFSDDRMLPPALRGYAPKLTGVARTNARVTISRGDSIVYEKMVPPGPFVIEDLTNNTSGLLTMSIREEDGEEQTSTIETSNVPFLTRSGHIRYKVVLGQMVESYGSFKPMLATAEASIGILSGISLFGGTILTDKDYYAFNNGIGYDMGGLGALSIDVTHARAHVNSQSFAGESYRFNYSKVFDSIDSQITFAGYRFSEKNYLSLDNLAFMKSAPNFAATNKENYNLVASKNFHDVGLSVNLIYNRQTYWQDVSDSNSYGLSVSKSFDIGNLKNINAYVSINRTEFKTSFLSQEQKNNNTVYLGLSIPLDSHSYLSTGMQFNNSQFSPSTTYTNSADLRNVWSIGANTSSPNFYSQSNLNGNIVQNQDAYSAAFNASVNKDNYYLGGSIKSGITATEYGVAMHRDGYAGNTRLMIDTNGIEGVYVGNQSANDTLMTNAQGITMINNVPDYYRTNYTIDTNRLPDDVESTDPNIQMVLTEGAIGYRKLNLYRGIKALIKLTDAQGRAIPFGTSVDDSQQKRQVGVVGENGEVYVSGIAAGARLTALNGEGLRCTFILPKQNFSLSSVVPLTCRKDIFS